ncbi:MAG TPA: response regulator [Candidatus Angelobacter sp.]|jgi:CheY-like chemotaxis protein|nr:response regulator [Candidatus Angelobacter sp.]
MPKKILIVDDSSTALMMETMILSKTGYELVTASDGQQAVEKARAESPDLILMDVVMPTMNGFEACREIRGDARTSHVPIILVTTRGEEECVEAGFNSGCSDYITKPVNAQELVLLVQSYLDDK